MTSVYECKECEGGILVQSSGSEDLPCPKCQHMMIAEEGNLVRFTVSALPEIDTPEETPLRKTTSMTLSVSVSA
jgi:hypothetical protein